MLCEYFDSADIMWEEFHVKILASENIFTCVVNHP